VLGADEDDADEADARLMRLKAAPITRAAHRLAGLNAWRAKEVGEGRSSDPDFVGRLTPLTISKRGMRVSSEIREFLCGVPPPMGVYL